MNYLVAVFILFLLSGGSASAQDALGFNSGRDTPSLSNYSAPHDIKSKASFPCRTAMVFSKLTKTPADFEAWASESEAYKAAYDNEKKDILERKTAEMKGIYELLTQQEPLLVVIQAKLSSYNTIGKGFFIENFKEETFFPVRCAGQSYAIIPEEITERQWIKVEDPETAKAIEKDASVSPGGTLPMVLSMTPISADASSMEKFDGEKYWLLSTNIDKIEIYSSDQATILWQSGTSEAENAKRLELQKLRQ